MTILVSNLPSTVTEAQLDDLKTQFLSFGKVNKFEVTIIIQLESNEDAAIKALNDHLVEGHPIKVKGVKEGEESNSPFPTTPAPTVSHFYKRGNNMASEQDDPP